MAGFTYEEVTPSIIENTTMRKVLMDGVHRLYEITPIDGYVLHDSRMDSPEYDEETMTETGITLNGYRRSTASCPATYDFVTNPWGFYAVPESDVPADRIFGGGGNDNHEIM